MPKARGLLFGVRLLLAPSAMFSLLVLVFRSIFGKRDEPDRHARVAYEVPKPQLPVSIFVPSLTSRPGHYACRLRRDTGRSEDSLRGSGIVQSRGTCFFPNFPAFS